GNDRNREPNRRIHLGAINSPKTAKNLTFCPTLYTPQALTQQQQKRAVASSSRVDATTSL
ncbi:MAG: hypothetical protein KKA56_10160, partial [Gammaproteobacteria bacterium]|nr:hypothetical protein [Gammaproteobacteria bacterium]